MNRKRVCVRGDAEVGVDCAVTDTGDAGVAESSSAADMMLSAELCWGRQNGHVDDGSDKGYRSGWHGEYGL